MEALLREDIIKVIEGKGAAKRIRLLYDIWIYDNVFRGSQEKRAEWLKSYPCDVDEVFLQMPGTTEGYPETGIFSGAFPERSAGKKREWIRSV